MLERAGTHYVPDEDIFLRSVQFTRSTVCPQLKSYGTIPTLEKTLSMYPEIPTVSHKDTDGKHTVSLPP